VFVYANDNTHNHLIILTFSNILASHDQLRPRVLAILCHIHRASRARRSF
jgi:hypothetical protein